jgi:hypothetical protein
MELSLSTIISLKAFILFFAIVITILNIDCLINRQSQRAGNCSFFTATLWVMFFILQNVFI